MSDPTLPPPLGGPPGPPPGPPPWADPALPLSSSQPLAGIRQDAIRTQGQVDAGRRILRAVAIAAAVVWVLAVVLTTISRWHLLADQGVSTVTVPGVINQGSSLSGWDLIEVLAEATSATWGYALVAVAAYVASLWFDDSRARDLFEILDDADPDPTSGS